MKKKAVLFVFITVFCLSITTCFAESWYWIGQTADGDRQWFIDNDSVDKNSDHAKVFVKINYEDGTSIRDRYFFNHNKKEWHLLDEVQYDADGLAIGRYDFDNAVDNPIESGSMEEVIYHNIWDK